MRVARTPLAVALFAAALPLIAQQAVFVVRHAEKESESNDPPTPLSEAGRAQARRLAEILRDAGVTAIYSTDMVRTRATVEPLARMRNLPIRIYDSGDALVRTLRQADGNDVVLVVGHGNTVVPILEALGCRGKIPLGEREYDNLFVVVPRRDRDPELLRLKY